jgi:nitroreductase
MGFYDGLISRSSVRNFSNQPVSKEIIKKIIYAGHRAATANNVQPWIFVAVTDAEKRKVVKDMCPQNGPYIEFAPVCIAVFCKEVKYYLEDGSAATQNILNAAHSFGLGAVWVAGDKKEYAPQIRDYLNVPADYKLISLIPIGYPTEKVKLTEKKPIEEVLFFEEYNN